MAAPAAPSTKDLTQTAINTIRFLAVDAVEKANSGHPGMPMGMAPSAYVLWTQVMRYNPRNPHWPNRDRFVLSAGHGSMLLYAMLHLTGYDLPLDQLKQFRQWGSQTPGHPEYGDAPGIETTTGPLGQGLATAVGMAMAQRYLNSLFPSPEAPLFDHRIYGICSDGDLQEGVASEAASLAGTLGLAPLIFIYDSNKISIEGNTDIAFTEDVGARFRAYHWNVLHVNDGNDVQAIEAALRQAQAEKERPTLIITKTIIGYGSPNKANTGEVHGAALGPEEVAATKKNLGWPSEPTFFVPDEVKAHFLTAGEKGRQLEADWNARFEKWAAAHADKAALWQRLQKGALPDGWEAKLPTFESDEKLATRQASGKVINALAPVLPEFLGGSADLSPSNNTDIKGGGSFSKEQAGRIFHFGIREHAMAAALNGLALTDMLIPFGGTFLIFSDYMKGGMRITALSHKRVVYVLTHDSIGLGEDGPTHQPIEQLAHLRATPNCIVIRPADAVETAAAWAFAVKHRTGPVVLALTRQALPVLKKSKYPNAGQVELGAYVLSEAQGGTPHALLIATGSEVSLALGAQEKLKAEGIYVRVVSMPSWELFERQPQTYRDNVLPPTVRARVSIEALSTFGWDRWVGFDGAIIGMTNFGKSAPGPKVMNEFGFNVENVVGTVKKVLKK